MRKILVIDDEKLFCSVVATTLRQQGYEVEEAGDGADGLARAFAHPPSLILSDVNMAGQSGIEVLQELRAHPATAAIPVILMTGEPHQTGVRFSMDHGADDYLPKPFTMEQMLSAVAARLERRADLRLAAEAQIQTERTRTAEQLHLLTSALESAANGIAITQSDGTILWVNRAFTQLTGYATAEVVGQNPCLLKSGQQPAEFYAGLWATITAGHVWHGELVNQRKDGSCYYEEMTITPVRGAAGQIQNFIAIKQDISKRKQFEQELEREKKLLNSLMDNLPDHIYFKDAESQFTRINQAQARHLGLAKPEDAIGKTDADFMPLHVARQKLVDERRMLMAGEPIVGLEEISDTASGKRWVSTTKVPLRDETGRITGLVGISHDITNRKRAEEELQRKTTFLEAQLNSSIDGILVVDERGRKTLQNQRLTDLLKIPQAIAEEQDDENQRRWVTQTVKSPEQFLEKILYLNSHQNEISRDEIELKDGTILDRYSAPVLGKGGQYYGRLWTFRDATERRRADELLQDQLALRERLAKIAASAPGIIYAFRLRPDGSTCIPYASPTMEEFYGVRAEEVVEDASPAFDLVHPDDQPALRESTAESARTMLPWRMEFRVRHPKKGLFWIEGQSTPEQQADGSILWHGFMSDITGRKRTEAALSDSEKKYRGLFESSRDAILTVDPATRRFTSGNAAALRMFAAKNEAEFISYGPSDFSPERQPDGCLSVEKAREHSDTVLREGSHFFEWTHRRLTGEEFIADVLLTQIERGGKQIILATVRDITERKRADLERQLMEVQLRQSQKLESIGQLAAGIAHEINTPTQYVTDNTRFLQDAFGSIVDMLQDYGGLLAAAKAGPVPPALLAQLESARLSRDIEYLSTQIPTAIQETLEGVERVGKIVRAMKDFSHPGGHEKTPSDLNKAIESTATVARNEWKYVADLELVLDPHLPPVPCFLGEFNQAILNLIVNAAHAIGDVVRARPGAKGQIIIRTLRVGDQVEVRVTDTGTGIAEKHRGKIFEPFFTTKEVGQGTGQGLAAVYSSIVKKHGGTATFETEVGVGTTFSLRLPIIPPLVPGADSRKGVVG